VVGGETELTGYRGAEWHRISSTIGSNTVNYLYDGDNVVADLNGTSITKLYVTPFLDQNLSMTDKATGNTYYYTQDGLGSVRTLTDDPVSGPATVVNSYDYEAFGSQYAANTTVAVDQRYTYTGREKSSGGLMNYRYRTYDPNIGRFGRRDPAFSPEHELYGYVGGRPNVMIDPYGLWGGAAMGLGTGQLQVGNNGIGPSGGVSPGQINTPFDLGLALAWHYYYGNGTTFTRGANALKKDQNVRMYPKLDLQILFVKTCNELYDQGGGEKTGQFIRIRVTQPKSWWLIQTTNGPSVGYMMNVDYEIVAHKGSDGSRCCYGFFGGDYSWGDLADLHPNSYFPDNIMWLTAPWFRVNNAVYGSVFPNPIDYFIDIKWKDSATAQHKMEPGKRGVWTYSGWPFTR